MLSSADGRGDIVGMSPDGFGEGIPDGFSLNCIDGSDDTVGLSPDGFEVGIPEGFVLLGVDGRDDIVGIRPEGFGEGIRVSLERDAEGVGEQSTVPSPFPELEGDDV
jgi:hypothetical protein